MRTYDQDTERASGDDADVNDVDGWLTYYNGVVPPADKTREQIGIFCQWLVCLTGVTVETIVHVAIALRSEAQMPTTLEHALAIAESVRKGREHHDPSMCPNCSGETWACSQCRVRLDPVRDANHIAITFAADANTGVCLECRRGWGEA